MAFGVCVADVPNLSSGLADGFGEVVIHALYRTERPRYFRMAVGAGGELRFEEGDDFVPGGFGWIGSIAPGHGVVEPAVRNARIDRDLIREIPLFERITETLHVRD